MNKGKQKEQRNPYSRWVSTKNKNVRIMRTPEKEERDKVTEILCKEIILGEIMNNID